MIKARPKNPGYFTEYIYSLPDEKSIPEFDIILDPKGVTTEHLSDNYYIDELFEKIYLTRDYIPLKSFLAYQIDLYGDGAQNWINQLKQCIKHHKGVSFIEYQVPMIEDALDDILNQEYSQADLTPLFNIINISANSIHQLNLGNGSQTISYTTVLEQMRNDGVPEEIIDEGASILKDANQSDSLKKIAANWIKNLPFKIIEKAGDWALKNFDKMSDYQDSLLKIFNH